MYHFKSLIKCLNSISEMKNKVLLIIFCKLFWTRGILSEVGDVEWRCGEEGLMANEDLDVIDEESEQNLAVGRIEDKIQELRRMFEQLGIDEEPTERLDRERGHDNGYFTDQYNTNPIKPFISSRPTNPDSRASVFRPEEPSQTEYSYRANQHIGYFPLRRTQTSLKPQSLFSTGSSQLGRFSLPAQPQNFKLKLPQNKPLAQSSSLRSQTESLSPKPSLFQTRPNTNFKQFSTKLQTSLSEPHKISRLSPILRSPTNDSRAESQSSKKKLQSFWNKPSASKWYHPASSVRLDIQIPQYCDKLYNDGTRRDGVYDVTANGNRIEVFCEFQKNGYNWLVFQRREDGSIDFYKNWTQYDAGFGSKTGEFWLGLSHLHELTRLGSYVLRVDLEDFDGSTAFAEYSSFAVESPSYNFRLCVNGYRGNAGDALSYHNGIAFSTYDRDHDNHYRGRNCAEDDHGAWWYNSCQHSNLNGEYLPGGVVSIRGIVWYQWKHNHYSMKSASMKLRPA